MKFGTAGIPLSAQGQGTEKGIEQVRNLGLDAMEIEFVRNVYLKEDKTAPVKEAAKKHDITLTCHAPYFINLNSLDKKKLAASKYRILNSARIMHLCEGYSVCFHPGFYMKMDEKKVYENVKKELKDIIKTLQNEGIDIWVRPETTGKGTQFGNIHELLKMSQEIEQVMPCIDFSHLHARTNGKYNTKKEFEGVLIDVEKHLGKEGLKKMHIHVSGIAYGEKGEKHHLILKESDFNYKDLLRALKDFKCEGVLISESPNIEQDAMLMQKTY